jgi:hypothetical protein
VNKNFKPREQAKHDTQGIALIATTDAQPPSPPLKRAPSSEKAASNKPASFTAKTEPTLRTHSTTANDDTTIVIKDGRATTIVKATSALPTNVASIAKVKPNAATSRRITFTGPTCALEGPDVKQVDRQADGLDQRRHHQERKRNPARAHDERRRYRPEDDH